MDYKVAPLNRLIEWFSRLPGIGKKTAARLAFYVLNLPQKEALDFADTIIKAKENVRTCRVCQNLTDKEVCEICADQKRDRTVVCVVEDPKDVLAFERTGEYRGLYHVLHGALSPLDNINPEDLKIKELFARLASGEITEVIMATNPTVEGEATAGYISRFVKPMGVKITRLAYGIPVGGDLEYTDEITLSRALEGRHEI
ncbi:MAG: recombination protein RecR [Oscillospiraceae bacterium]|nr:recombination protein RecR [Candidatus Equicaccousia limihippi]